MQQIGRYQILKELGRGAMGVVYAASDPTIGRTVAIKTIHLYELTGSADRTELRERLRREAQAAGMLSHPGIVTVHDVGEENGEAFIVMEFIDGTTLEDILKSGIPQPSQTLIGLTVQAAEALDYAHGKGIIHRDLKPSNIIVCKDGRIKIADFGIARIHASTSMTQTGFVLGRPDYMSPEQAQAKPLDGRSDQFSLAVMACRMLTGMLPFHAPAFTAVLAKILWEEPQYLDTNLHPSMRAVLRKALNKDPIKRYARCVDFAQDLERAYLSTRPIPARQESAQIEVHTEDGEATSPSPYLAGSPARTTEADSGTSPKMPIVAQSHFQTHEPRGPSETETVVETNDPPPIAATAHEGDPVPQRGLTNGNRLLKIGMAAAAGFVLLAVFLGVFARSHRAKPAPPVTSQAPLALSPAQTAQAASAEPMLPPPDPKPTVVTSAVAKPPESEIRSEAPAKKTQPVKNSPSAGMKSGPKQAVLPAVVPASQQPPISRTAIAMAAPKNSARLPRQKPAELPSPPETGELKWTGRLGKNSVLVISDQHASTGTLIGQLPGMPVSIKIEPSSVIVRQPPEAGNGWKQIMLYGGAEKHSEITIRWTALK